MTPADAVRALLWAAIYGEVPLPAPLTTDDIKQCRARLECFVQRFGEDRIVDKLRNVNGLETIDLDKARAVLGG
ncbi:hypothetical protein A9X03_14195 [Mycobacterium sp. E1715]|uniref:hypothetical protein n=1 Tax=Mycobacterium sp. E1715 TaxID=1856863 RepID=UPI0007FC6C5F|nr:hypothetical protein [Mycobacterium sp. E1715]OBH23900.1 hypothetical protein A9X03_14195 [Mycobacterium sp. E1715]